MAEVEALSKTVKALFINREEEEAEAEKHICKVDTEAVPGGVPAASASLPLMDIPIIDFSLLTSPSSSIEELQKLLQALSSGGSFQAINHGIPTTLLDKVREVTHQFYELPSKNKLNYCREYGKPEGYRSDIVSEHQVPEWPDKPETFKEIMHEYAMRVEVMREVLFKAMAKSLKLNENCFLEMCGEKAMLVARFNHYPPCPRPDLILGFKPHSDGSVMSIVLQDKEVEGLQFLKDNQWYRVPINPQALLVNVGDQAQIMSNGIFKSPIHKVVTNSKRQRISVVVFCLPNSEKEIEPIDELVNETRPRLYKKLKDYANFYIQNYQQGKTPLEEAII
ncbi:2-oxoglutarate (2OG) and Fe(II)-dependent oxygenase superfamily protein [Melia azedarach]|uniref:2-oxoglutarate (2OG) and Fe(II)-dependent oxygenase superfamily protein n=1 Tax=Melia azedarach TaxID=155640 RepID=A0ACC1YLI7_MELAZ|nr:2-oxoglutarate (2OG) and Fe(II)-dependent oxygenase superfamily protein [Melia azedarach]